MPVTQQYFEENDFFHTHNIEMDGTRPVFRTTRGRQVFTDAGIYVWASPMLDHPDRYDALYVGKAGYGLRRRLGQHAGSFRDNGAGTGQQNRQLIVEWLATGRTLQVWGRLSPSINLFGQETSLYSAEEAAACDAFEPLWNRANFPRAPNVGAAVPDEPRPGGNPPLVAAAFEAVPHGDEVAAFVGGLDEPTQARFMRIMDFVQQRHADAGDKIVRGYTGQPPGYNQKPMLVVGQIRATDGRAVNWNARIPLVNEDDNPLTIIFPGSRRSPLLAANRFAEGDSGVWRPLGLDEFLNSPPIRSSAGTTTSAPT